jgi:hypothetical protein
MQYVNFFSQARFLYGMAKLAQSFTRIDHWWLGLTDMGKLRTVFFFVRARSQNCQEMHHFGGAGAVTQCGSSSKRIK